MLFNIGDILMRVFHQQEREKRRRRVLIEQMKAHEAQEVIANT